MISFKRRQDSPQSPQDSSGLPRVMRTLLCGLRARRRPAEVLDKVLRQRPNHSRVAVGKRET
jgi:hypothetical protein